MINTTFAAAVLASVACATSLTSADAEGGSLVNVFNISGDNTVNQANGTAAGDHEFVVHNAR